MTEELKTIFEQFANIINRWNANEIPNYEELLEETKTLNAKLRAELLKPQKEQKKVI